MIELNITKNDNAIYDIHFRTRNKALAKKIHQLLLEEFEKEEQQEIERLEIKKPRIELDEPSEIEKEEKEEKENKKEESNWETLLAEGKTGRVLLLDEDVEEQKEINPTKMLESTEEAGRKAVAEEREKAEKRKSFWGKVLYQISKESPATYSMLAVGYPAGSNGSILIVNVPDATYQIIEEDKRISDIVARAISNTVNNPNVSIKFQSEGNMSMETKLQTRLDATKVSEDDINILY